MITSISLSRRRTPVIHGSENIGKKPICASLPKHPSLTSIKTIHANAQVSSFASKHGQTFIPFCNPSDADSTFANTSVPYSQEGYVHYVVDAVFTLVIAIQKLIDEKCSPPSTMKGVCDEFFPFDGARLLTIVRNVTFRNGKTTRSVISDETDRCNRSLQTNYQVHQ